ncbi:MAG: right-handed parallel beta-helix repeat-containing protein [Candidatus Brocadiia bacterium]
MGSEGKDQKTFYVSPQGDDAASGTKEDPFSRIQQAAEIMTPGDTCIVHEGLYRETVEVSGGGETERPIRFQTANGETVVLTGNEPLSAQWEKHTDDIWKTTIDEPFEQLFVGPKMMAEARWPGPGANRLVDREHWAAAEKTGHGWVTDPELAEMGIDATGAVAWLSVAHQFYAWSRRVTRHEAGDATFRYDANLQGLAAWEQRDEWPQPEGENAPRYCLFGKLEFLTEPGEWVLDRETNILYFWPPEGADPNDVKIEVKCRPLAFDVTADHVQLSGFCFLGTSFRFRDCAHGFVENCHLRYPTFGRFFPDPGGDRPPQALNVLTATTMTGRDHVIRGCSLKRSSMAGLEILGAHSLVEDCLVQDVCWNGSLRFAGIRLSSKGSDEESEGHGVVRRCEVFDGGNCLVHVGHMPTNTVELCHIHDGGKACKDVSLLYTQLPLIRGTVFRYNWVHSCHSPHIALGIRGDDQTRGLTIHHNVVWDCGWEGIICKGNENQVHHNTCFDNGTGQGFGDIRLDSAAEPEKPWRRKQWPLLDEQNQKSEAYNNFAVIKGGRPNWHEEALPGGKRNCNLSGCDPMLRNVENCDFRPMEDSPLVNAGRVVPGITGAFSGEKPDIGAYQHDGKLWKPGCSPETCRAAEAADRAIAEMLRVRGGKK